MLITSDLHDIAARLKEIDPEYTLHLDRKTNKFELHGKNDDKLLVFEYDRIDARMVEHARRTRVERIAEIVAEIERNNELLERTAEATAVKDLKDAFAAVDDRMRYKN